jgi:hypothetical protein
MQSLSKVVLAGLAALALIAQTATARADVIFDDTASIDPGNTFFVANRLGGPLAESFSTDPLRMLLTDLKLVLGDVLATADKGSLTVSLLSDNAATPGSLMQILATIPNNSLPSWSAPGLYDIPLAPMGIVLDGNTRYWIQLSSPAGTYPLWYYTTDMTGPGVGSEYTAYAGSTFVSPNSNPDFGAFQMQVQAIPEPGSLSLLGAAMAGIALFIRRRARPA